MQHRRRHVAGRWVTTAKGDTQSPHYNQVNRK